MKLISSHLLLLMLLKRDLETRNLGKKVPKVQLENNSMLWAKRQSSSPPRSTPGSKNFHVLESLSKILFSFLSFRSQNSSLHLGLRVSLAKMLQIFVVQMHYKLKLFCWFGFFPECLCLGE